MPTDSGYGYWEIFAMNPDGSDRRRITLDGGTYVKTVQGEEDETYDVYTASFSPTWSPDGTRLAFLFHTPDDSFELRTADADGQDMQVLFDDWTASMLSWSPDGTEIAYGDDRGLWVANADGSSPRLIAEPSPDIPPMGGPGTVEVVSWSPAGSAIAFAEWARCGCGGGSAFVNIVDVDGGNMRHNVCDHAYTDSLDWTPDGATLLCDGDGLLSVQADGTGLTRLVDGAGAPASSPSGSQVLFTGRQGGEDLGLWCYDMATAASSLVLSPFTWSPDLAWQPHTR
jgi:Tol biopolymer transport system component